MNSVRNSKMVIDNPPQADMSNKQCGINTNYLEIQSNVISNGEFLERVYEPIKQDLSSVETLLGQNLKTRHISVDKIYRHILSTKGKRIRPTLTLLCHKIGKYGNGNIIPLATAFEMIHTASLIHDDIIDDSNKRRWKISLNKRWGNQIAVLAGDSLYTRAISLVCKNVSSEISCLLVEATNQMCEGEMEQIKNRKNVNLNESEYLEITKNKTAILMATCCQTGAMLSKTRDNKVDSLKNFGMNFGIAYQIVDDCLDLTGIEESDLNDGKVTLPLIYLINGLSSKERKELNWLMLLRIMKNTDRKNEVINYAFNKVKEYISKAREQIISIPRSPFKQSLDHLLNCVSLPSSTR